MPQYSEVCDLSEQQKNCPFSFSDRKKNVPISEVQGLVQRDQK